MREDHDHHCWVTFSGRNWRIIWMDGASLGVRSEIWEAVLDLSQVDWESYVAACEAFNKQYYP